MSLSSRLCHVRLRILFRTSAFDSSVLNAFLHRISREVSVLILVVAGFPPAEVLLQSLHRTMAGLWDPSFQTSHTSGLLGGTQSLLGREDPRPLVFLAAGPTLCLPAVLRKPSVRSSADGPSAPTHLTSLASRGLGAFLCGCGSNSLCSCLHASNPKPLGACWTTCSLPVQVRTSTQYACAENRFSALVIAVLSVMIGSSTLVSTCCSIQAVVRLNFPK